MSDEEVADAELVLQPLQELQNRFGDELVEGGGDLVADDEVGFGGESTRDRDALLLRRPTAQTGNGRQ